MIPCTKMRTEIFGLLHIAWYILLSYIYIYWLRYSHQWHFRHIIEWQHMTNERMKMYRTHNLQIRAECSSHLKYQFISMILWNLNYVDTRNIKPVTLCLFSVGWLDAAGRFAENGSRYTCIYSGGQMGKLTRVTSFWNTYTYMIS